MLEASDRLRVGVGYDAHRTDAARALVLGGVRLAETGGLAGHSDADVVCHVLIDACLSAAGLGDIGRMFPSDDAHRDAASIDLLARAWSRLSAAGFRLVNADVLVVCQRPSIAPHAASMAARVAAAIGCDPDRVTVRGTGTDGLGFTGRGEGIAAHCAVLIARS